MFTKVLVVGNLLERSEEEIVGGEGRGEVVVRTSLLTEAQC